MSSLFKPIDESKVGYGDTRLNQEAIENFYEEYGRPPTPEELDEYVISTEEIRYFLKKRDGCLVN